MMEEGFLEMEIYEISKAKEYNQYLKEVHSLQISGKKY